MSTTFVMVRSAALAKQLDEERAALDTAKTRLAELQAQRQKLLLDSDDDGVLAAHDNALAAAKRAADRHAARAARLEREHQEASAAEAEAERLHRVRTRWNKRKAIVEDGRRALNDYRQICGELVRILERMQAADRAAAETFDDRPEGQEKLEGPSRSRYSPFVPRQTKFVEELAWVDSAGRPVAAMIDANGEPVDASVRRAVVKIERVVPQQYAWTPEPLYRTVNLPGIFKADPAFWEMEQD